MKPAKDVRVVAYVEWIDSGVIAAAWASLEDVPKGIEDSKSLIRSAGLLLTDDDEGVTLVGSLNDTHDELTLAMWIPRVAIKRIDVWTP